LEDFDLLHLDVPEVPMVVSAARRAQAVTSVPCAVSVITAEDIRLAGARSVPDALRLAAGMDVADATYGFYSASARGFHGLVSRSLLVLVDGRQIYDTLFGGTAWTNWPIQIEDIDRIEVIRGPGGVTWGANAMNGVVNIITKDPKDQQGLTVVGGGGSRGTHKEHLGYAFADKKLRLRVSGEYEASDGFERGGSILGKLRDDYKNGRMGLHAIYEATEQDTVTFSGGSGLLDGGAPMTPMAGIGVRRNSGAQASFLLGKWSHEIAEDNEFELTGYVNDFRSVIGFDASEYRYQQLALQLSHTFKPADDHTLVWGFDSRVDLLDGSNADPFIMKRDHTRTAILGLYVQDEWQLAPKWTLNLGARIDYEFYGGFEPSGRAALSYAVTDDAMLYGAVSRAFQTAPLGLRFLTIPVLNGLGRAVGHRDVDTEPLVAYEFGYRQKFFKRLDVNVNLFWHEYSDLTTISPVLGPPALVAMDLANRADASTYGVELEGKYAVTDRLTLLGHYTFERLNWRSEAAFHEKEVISPPKHKFMIGTRWSATDDLHLSSHLYFVDAVKSPNPAFPFVARPVPGYFRLDVRGEYEFWEDRASVAVGVRNLLDDNHYEGGTLFLNSADTPRMVYAEMRVTFR
ncbi:MAG: TonB-dependent receptor, partial [Phycisphaerae bacterium]|nr:TonB-dependent receptor [Phycisphaerae bacterium]